MYHHQMCVAGFFPLNMTLCGFSVFLFFDSFLLRSLFSESVNVKWVIFSNLVALSENLDFKSPWHPPECCCWSHWRSLRGGPQEGTRGHCFGPSLPSYRCHWWHPRLCWNYCRFPPAFPRWRLPTMSQIACPWKLDYHDSHPTGRCRHHIRFRLSWKKRREIIIRN